jgi:hypothetical protein
LSALTTAKLTFFVPPSLPCAAPPPLPPPLALPPPASPPPPPAAAGSSRPVATAADSAHTCTVSLSLLTASHSQ